MTNQAMPATTKRAIATIPITIPTFPPTLNPLAVADEILVVAEAVPLADVELEEVAAGDELM
jgi:hypothetical protein